MTLGMLLLAAAGQAGTPVLQDYGPPRVGVLLQFEKPAAPGFLKPLEQEVGKTFRAAGIDVRWEVLSPQKRVGTYDRVIIAQMRGACGFPRVATVTEAPDLRARLGWTMVNEGDVIPHSVIDCEQIARVVAQWRRQGARHATIPALYYRLASRVLTHEMMHVLLKTPDHDHADFTRSPLRSSDFDLVPKLNREQIAALMRAFRPTPPASLARQ